MRTESCSPRTPQPARSAAASGGDPVEAPWARPDRRGRWLPAGMSRRGGSPQRVGAGTSCASARLAICRHQDESPGRRAAPGRPPQRRAGPLAAPASPPGPRGGNRRARERLPPRHRSVGQAPPVGCRPIPAFPAGAQSSSLLVEIPADEDDRVGQRADAGNVDGDHIARPEAERLVRHDARARQQHRADREGERSHQPTGEVLEPTGDARGAGGPLEFDSLPAPDAEGDVEWRVRGYPSGHDGWSEGARPVVNLRLWQIEGILSLDGAAAHVVAHHVAEDLTRGIEDQAELGLRDVPGGVGADADRLSVADHALRRGLEDQLGAPSHIDPVVHTALGRLLDPTDAAPLVGHAGTPHLLRVHRWQQTAVEICRCTSGLDSRPRLIERQAQQVVQADQQRSVPLLRADRPAGLTADIESDKLHSRGWVQSRGDTPRGPRGVQCDSRATAGPVAPTRKSRSAPVSACCTWSTYKRSQPRFGEANAPTTVGAGMRRISSSSGTSSCSRRRGTSSRIGSPSSTTASTPPSAASGATCSTTVPYAVPLILPSQTRTMSRTPNSSIFRGSGRFATSGMPGYPFGPQPRSTSTESGVTGRAGSSMRA